MAFVNFKGMTRLEILDAAIQSEHEVADFFGSLTDDEFVLRVDGAWTPEEHLMHLNTAISAVARGFGINRWLLRFRFGRAKRASRSFEEVRADYHSRLAAGGRAAGGFIPQVQDESRAIATRRSEVLARWQRVNARLRAAAANWSETDLERLQLPHPLLGKISGREMLYFAIYHNSHHIANAKKRLPRFTS